MSLDHGVLMSLADLARRWDELARPADHLYVEGRRDEWTERSLAAVVELDQYEEEPETLEVDGVQLRYVLAAFQVKEVARNLGNEASRGERLVAALRHCHEFDGFVEA